VTTDQYAYVATGGYPTMLRVRVEGHERHEPLGYALDAILDVLSACGRDGWQLVVNSSGFENNSELQIFWLSCPGP
jgi:hypothetical protein